MRPVEVTDLVTDLKAFAARLDPDQIDTGDVPTVITDLGCAVRLVEGMATLMARRATDVVGRTGEKGAAALLARSTGTTPTQAKKTLTTSTRLKDQPRVADAVRSGQLSGVQAEAVTAAVEADPTAELDLLDAAGQQSVQDLRRTCRDRRMAADPDRAATRRRHLARRSFRSWTESDGEWKAMVSGPADHGARFEAALRAEHDAVFRAAHAEGRREEDAAYCYDALLALIERGADADTDSSAPEAQGQPSADKAERTGGEQTDQQQAQPGQQAGAVAQSRRPHAGRRRTGRQTKVIITVPAAALKRDRVDDGETCTIAGVGEVSLDAVKALIPNAHIAYVITHGVDATVIHYGRQASAHQRTALKARGYECGVPHCRSTHLLEIDHIADWAWSKQTVVADLAWLCPTHHEAKSRHRYRLSGPPGQRAWTDATVQTISQDALPDDPLLTDAAPEQSLHTSPDGLTARLPAPEPVIALLADRVIHSTANHAPVPPRRIRRLRHIRQAGWHHRPLSRPG